MTKAITGKKVFLMPTTYFSIPLGIGALAIAWSHAAHLFNFSKTISTILGVTSVIIWVIFSILYIYKIIAYREQVLEEYECPVRFSFLALIPVTGMIEGDIVFQWSSVLGEILIWLGVIGQIIYSSARIGSLWKGNLFTKSAVQPSFYLPTVAANFASASSLALLKQNDLGYLFFGAGMLAWIIYEPILLQHLRTNLLDSAIRPSMGIILAPAFVGASAYLALNGGEIDIFVKMLWGYGFLQLFFLIRIMTWIMNKNFSIGLWSFSFGLASMVNGAIFFYQKSNLNYIGLFGFLLGNIVITILLFGTIKKILQRQFWVR